MKEAHPVSIRSFLLAVLILSSSALQALAYYHPDEGRWLSRDPIEENGGVHLYANCGNNLVNRFDRIGLSCCQVESFTIVSHDFISSDPHWYLLWFNDYKRLYDIEFKLVLKSGSKKSDCVINQIRKGTARIGNIVDNTPNWIWDEIGLGAIDWWTGDRWTMGKGGRWSWFGKDTAKWGDTPGFLAEHACDFPGNMNVEFYTQVQDATTRKTVSYKHWRIDINYTTPSTGTHLFTELP